MGKTRLLFLISMLCGLSVLGQYTMSTQTVTACEGTLTDSEANQVNAGYYDHNENYSFTICPPNTVSITITFTFFETELNNDIVRIFDGPDTNSPLIGGPFSGANLQTVVVSNGCITINFISDINVAAEGFALNWVATVLPPTSPNISLPITIPKKVAKPTIQRGISGGRHKGISIPVTRNPSFISCLRITAKINSHIPPIVNTTK